MGSLHPYTRGSLGQTLKPDGGTLSFALTNDHVTAVLDALAGQGQTNVLSAPRLTMMQNQPATISITEEVPYYETSRQAVGQEVVLTTNVNFRSAGILLTVTAQISEDGFITLRVAPTISSISGYTRPFGNLEPVPILDQRSTTTTVRARDGQTVVIGGLMSKRLMETKSNVPGLGKVPGLGALFSNTNQQLRNTELVVVLTPTVVETGDLLEITALDLERLDKAREPFTLGPLFLEN
jgi:type II secretory pathway component GspD/PulD (secretin)